MKSIKYFLPIFLIVLFILGQLYFIGFIVSVLDWYFHLKPEVSTLVFSVLFFILSFYVFSKVQDLESIFLSKSFTSFKSYLYFLVLSLLSFFWSIHVIFETEVNKSIKDDEVYYNVKKMCLYHTKHLYEDILSKSVQANDQVTNILFTSSLSDLKSGKLKVLFTYTHVYYDEEASKLKSEIQTYVIANGIVKIKYKRR